MPGLAEEFEAYKQSQTLAQEYENYKALQAHNKDLAAGGSIRQAPIERNPPIGAIVGGIGGASLGIATANPAVALGMGALGAAAGEGVQQMVEHAIGSPAAPQSSLESAGRMLEESGMQTLGEGVGRLVGLPLVGRVVLRPSSHVTAEGAQAMKFMEPRMTQPYLPAEVSDHWGTDILHNVAEHAVIGGAAIKEFKANREKVFQGLADEIVDQVGPRMSPDTAARVLIKAIEGNKEIASIPQTMLYNSIEKMAAPDYVPVPVKMSVQRDMGDLMETQKGREIVRPKRAVTQEAEEGMRSPQLGRKPFDTGWTTADTPEETALRGLNVKTMWQDVKVGERLEHLKVMVAHQEQQVSGAKINLTPIKENIAGLLKTAQEAGGLADREMGTTLLKFMADKPDYASYPAAKQMRTAIRTFQETLQNSPETKYAPAIARAKSIYSQLTTQIRQGLKEQDPFLAQQWDEANFMTAASNKQFNDAVVRSLVKKIDETRSGVPDRIAQEIFKPNNVTNIKKIKNAVADDEAWNKVLSVKLQDIFEQALPPGSTTSTGALRVNNAPDGAMLEKAMFGRTGVGAEAMTAAFGPQRVAQYREFINALKVAQQGQASGLGGMFIQLQQASAAKRSLGAVMQMTGVGLVGAGAASDDYVNEGMASGTAFIIAPWMLSRLMTSPTGAKLIIEGMKTPAGTPAALGLAGRILAEAIPHAPIVKPPDTAERRTMALPPTTIRPMQMQE